MYTNSPKRHAGRAACYGRWWHGMELPDIIIEYQTIIAYISQPMHLPEGYNASSGGGACHGGVRTQVFARYAVLHGITMYQVCP